MLSDAESALCADIEHSTHVSADDRRRRLEEWPGYFTEEGVCDRPGENIELGMRCDRVCRNGDDARCVFAIRKASLYGPHRYGTSVALADRVARTVP